MVDEEADVFWRKRESDDFEIPQFDSIYVASVRAICTSANLASGSRLPASYFTRPASRQTSQQPDCEIVGLSLIA